MKLFFRRGQSESGTNEKLVFILSFRVELTPKEKALITKFRTENYRLVTIIDQNSAPTVNTVFNKWWARTAYDKSILLKGEDVLKRACLNFKTLLKLMASFSCEEVIEF